jgi:hypothetical protein
MPQWRQHAGQHHSLESAGLGVVVWLSSFAIPNIIGSRQRLRPLGQPLAIFPLWREDRIIGKREIERDRTAVGEHR